MLTLKHFRPYTPEYLDKMVDALYLESELGEDWYCHQSRFRPETLKVCYDETGRICSLSYDASRLCPSGLSVTEVEPAEVPEGISLSGSWFWDGQQLVNRNPVD